MNLQERLERILEDRRSYVVGTDPSQVNENLRALLPTCAEGVMHAANTNERDDWLVRLCGLALYALHPYDEAKAEVVVAGLDPNGEPAGLPRPAPAGQRVHVLDPNVVLVADGKGGWLPQDPPDTAAIAHAFTGLNPDGSEHEVPFTVHKRGDGRWRRKPRPDRV